MRFERADGGSIQTSLGYGIRVNATSTLKREWLVGHDSLAPADLEGPVGIQTAYSGGGTYSVGSYKYSSTVRLRTRQAIAAVEIRFVLFDIWGEFVKTLSMTEVEDIPADTVKTFTPSWNVYSENEASEYYASIAYVARVRDATGKVYQANGSPVVAEARKFSTRFTPTDLDPRRRPPIDSAKAK